MRRFNGQETTSTTVRLHGRRSLGGRREGHGETAVEVPETQHLLSRVQAPIREEMGYWDQTQSKHHPVRTETGRCRWEKATLSRLRQPTKKMQVENAVRDVAATVASQVSAYKHLLNRISAVRFSPGARARIYDSNCVYGKLHPLLHRAGGFVALGSLSPLSATLPFLRGLTLGAWEESQTFSKTGLQESTANRSALAPPETYVPTQDSLPANVAGKCTPGFPGAFLKDFLNLTSY